jgi:glycosyltransferase involved in cell wall biosynthesis
MRIAMLTSDSREVTRRYSEPAPSFGTAPQALLEGLAEIRKCEVHVVCCVQRPVRSPEKLADNIFYHSIVVPKWGWMRGAYLGCVRAVRKKLRQIRPALVHGQGTERECAIGAVNSGFPNVVTIHGNMREIARINQARTFSFLWLAARLESWTLRRTEGVLCNSAYTRQNVSPLARTTWMAPNALREIFFSPARGGPDSPPILLNIGVISPRKAQNELLDLAARLHQHGAKFQMQFIGSLDERTGYGAEFGSRLNRAQQGGYACHVAHKSEGELVELMDRAAGLVHFPKEEAFGLVVAEGLARNLKLFGAKVGGIMDIASGVEGAELFDRSDVASLEASILKWLSMGSPKIKQGAEEMRHRYHPAVIAKRHLEIYRQVLEGSLGGHVAQIQPEARPMDS